MGLEQFKEDWAKDLGVQNNEYCIAAEIIKPETANYSTAAALISEKSWVHDQEFLNEMLPHVRELWDIVKEIPTNDERAQYIYETWVPWYKANVRTF